MNIALQTALVSASIAAVVSLSVAVFSPMLTHHLWKRQKRKEQQLVIAERYAVLLNQLIASDNLTRMRDRSLEDAFRFTATEIEFRGMLFVIQVLFESGNVKDRARKVAQEGDPGGRAVLMAYLFAEALDLPFNKIPKLM